MSDMDTLVKNMRKVEGAVWVRKGVKTGWMELVVEKKGGGEKIRLIGKMVDKFLSEEGDVDI
jgi:hypothetical protein